MAEYQLLVCVTTNIFVVEFTVKILVDREAFPVLLRPYMRELCPSSFLIRLSLLGKTLDSQQFRVGIGFGPFGDEDVVLKVHGCQICDIVSKLFDGGADFGGEGSRRKDG